MMKRTSAPGQGRRVEQVQTSAPPIDGDSLLRLILESAVGFAIICTDLDGRIFTWNEGARRIFGHEEAEVVGRSAKIIFTPEDVTADQPGIEMRQALAEGRADDERWHVRKDGSRFWASGLMMPLKKPDGPAQGFLKIVRDLTEQRRAADAFQASEGRFHTVIENLPHKVWFLPVGGDPPFVNRGWRAYTGFTPAQGSRWPELLHPDDAQAQMELRRQAVAAGEPYELRTRIRRADGVYRWQLVQMVPLKDDAGRIFAWLGSWTDIEEIVAAETALAEALQRQELLTQEASHRVKNTLQILASLLALQARAAKQPEVRRALQDAGARITTAAQVHDRLWRQHELSSVDLDAFLRDLCDDLGRNSAGCRLEYEGRTILGSADLALPLGLIVNELVTNAFKYACAGGDAVQVRLERKAAGGLRLEVADRGPGLPDGLDLDGDGNSNSLGMRLVSVFVRQLGGTLEVGAADPGTRFAIDVPLGDADQ